MGMTIRTATTVRTVRDAIELLGGPAKAARKFGRTSHRAANNWVRRGAIPAALRPRVDAALEKMGATAHPSIYRGDAHTP
jgi:hypothetical protein